MTTQLNKCYNSDMNDNTYFKEDIDGIPFKTCEENQISYTINGENADFPCDGHSLEVYPSETNPL
jgi:hypothetical protein